MQAELDDVLTYTCTDFRNRVPAAHAALLALSRSGSHPGLAPALLELVRVRASHVNRCPLLEQLHARRARSLGVPEAQLRTLPSWRTSPHYTERERAALAWCEALTQRPHLRDIGLLDIAAVVRGVFEEDEFVHLTVAIAGITAWNAAAVGLALREDGK
jgi:AhpD family alkylhydroperoxidase